MIKEKIHKKDLKIGLLFFCLFMIFGYYSSYQEDSGLFDFKGGPYSIYYSNHVIKILNHLAFILDLLLVICIFVSWMFFRFRYIKICFICLEIIGIFLVWEELYYGSTFYYGEVRGEQFLPFLVNNFGLAGSMIFTCDLILNFDDFGIKIPILKDCPFLTTFAFHFLSVYYLNEPWKFFCFEL